MLRVEQMSGLEMGKNPHCWGSVLFGFYKKLGFGSVQFEFFASTKTVGSVLFRFFCRDKVWFCSVLYRFRKRLTVSSQLITQLENCNL